MAAPRYIQTVSMPTEYDRQAAEARRRQALAEALEAQAYQPLSGSAAPIPSAAPLVMALQSYLTARQRRKGEEAGEKATQMEQEFARRMAGRLEGGYTYKPTAQDAETLKKRPDETPEQYQQRMGSTEFTNRSYDQVLAATPQETTLGEITPTAQYRKAPQEALSMAMTPLGMGAMKRAPLLAAALEKSMEKPKPEEFTIESTGQGLMRVGKTTGTAQPVTYQGKPLMPRDAYSMGMTPQQQAQFDLDVRKYGLDYAQAKLAQAKAADEGVDISGISLPGMPRTNVNAVPPPGGTTPATNAPMATGGAPTTVRQPAAARPPAGPTTVPGQGEMATDVPLIRNPTVSAKQKRELLVLEPQARVRAASTQSEIQSLVDIANDLKNHPGLPEITGKLGQYGITDLSPEAREARGLYDTLLQKTSLLKTQMVREANATGGAFGSMTEKEWPRLESAFGNISNAQDPAGLITSLNNYINNVNRMGTDNLGIYENTYGKLKWNPIEYTPLSKKYEKKETPSSGQSGQWGRAEVVR